VKRIVVLGATGSIGASLFDIVRKNRKRYRIELVSCHTSVETLAEIAEEFEVPAVYISDESVSEHPFPPCVKQRFFGRAQLKEALSSIECDLVVNAIVGAAGLEASFFTLQRGINLALANKESLVAGGELLTQVSKSTGARIFPVDSEHSALQQCLLAGAHGEVEKLILTASGGPFRTRSRESLSEVTPAEALKHPNWSMGSKITIDSATMMNKGLEVIEAHFLFGLPPEKIEVVIHPQSIVHSMIQFQDGAIIAQLSPPDMRLPIAYALEFPWRMATGLPRLDISRAFSLDFEPPDTRKFPTLVLAYEALRLGGLAPLRLNAANEIAVAAFLAEEIKFTDIPTIIEYVVGKSELPSETPPTLGTLLEADRQARVEAREFVENGTLQRA
jgi:1-deoxy-D-xylulose-5-phosphate reductoisomerase